MSTTTRFIYDGQDVVRDTDVNGVPTADYLNGLGIDDKLRQTTGAASLYFLTDHLGSTRQLTDAFGNVVEQSNYDSFGNNAGSALTRYGYTGRERDSDTGLLYYRARFYDPQLGRFISEDPIGFAGGDVNLYGYVWHNPLSYTDPSGLDGRQVIGPTAEMCTLSHGGWRRIKLSCNSHWRPAPARWSNDHGGHTISFDRNGAVINKSKLVSPQRA